MTISGLKNVTFSLAAVALGAASQAQLTAVFTAIGSTGDAFHLDTTLPSNSVVAWLSADVVINRDDNIPSMQKKGAPIVTMRGVRPLNAPNRPSAGYLIAEQNGETMATITLYNNGTGVAKSHSYDCQSAVSLNRPSDFSDLKSQWTGVKWNYRKRVTNLSWTPNLNLGFDDYEWTQTFSFQLPHTLTANAKVTGARTGKDGNFGTGYANVLLGAKFVTTLPVATVSVTLTGTTLGNRSILSDVTTIADGSVEYLAPDTDGGITILPLAATSGQRKIRIWLSGSLKKAVYETLSDGATVAVSVTPVFGDINGDNVIDSADEALMNARIANGASDIFLPDEFYDFNQDGVVNSSDLTILQGNLTQVGD